MITNHPARSSIAFTRILIVEDQQLVRAGMRAMVRHVWPDCEVLEAGSYDEAVAQLGKHVFDIALVDVDLRAQKSGLDVLAFIQLNGLGCRAVMLSAYDDRQTVIACVDAGASGYIAKGVGDEGVFERALSTIADGGIYLPRSILAGNTHPRGDWRPLEPQSAATLGLSPRLCEVLYYVCQGLPNKEIARMMAIAEGTVRKTYMTELMRFFGVVRRTELIVQVFTRNIRVPAP